MTGTALVVIDLRKRSSEDTLLRWIMKMKQIFGRGTNFGPNKPPLHRATLLSAMEGTGKLVDDDELAEALKKV